MVQGGHGHAGAFGGVHLVGRDPLVEQLADAARAARDGSGSLVLLTGEAGIGKTSLARHLASGDHGLAVTWGRCSADAGAPPFWPWRDLVDPTADHDASSRRGDGGSTPFRYDALNRLRDAIVGRAASEPALHVIEDLQWADVASVLLVGHLAGTIDAQPLLLVATLRTGEPLNPALADAVEEVRRTARVLELAPLATDDIEAMMRMAGITPEPGLSSLIAKRTSGNPLFAAELIRTVSAERRAAGTVDALAARVPERVSLLMAHRQARLPAAVADLLATAAVFGHDGDIRALADAHGLPIAAALELLEQGRAAHFLDTVGAGRWQFRHQIVRDAVYQSLSSADRPQRHVRALDALAKDAATPPAVLAAHALAALPLIDDERAAALAARAGQAALAQFAFEEALTWFEQALNATAASSAPRWRAELLLLSAEAHRQIGSIDEARSAFGAAAEVTDDPDLVARAALGYASPGADLGIAFRNDDPTTAELLQRAIAVQPEGDSSVTVQLEARLGAELYFSDEPGAAQKLTERALDRARRLGDPSAMCAALAVYHDAFVIGQAGLDAQLDESQELLEWARAAGTAPALLTAHRARVFDLLAAADMTAMEEEVVAFKRVADRLRVPAYDWWPVLWSAMRALLEGRHDDAERLGLEAYGVGERPFASLAMFNLSFLLFFLRREQGRLTEIEALTRELAAERADIPALRVAHIFLLAEIGRTDEAADLLAAVDERALDRLRDRNWPASWFQLARAAMQTRDSAVASRLLDRRPAERCVNVSLATVSLGAVDLAVAWAHHARGDLDAAEQAYRDAEQVNARIGARSWLAQTRADLARLLIERDRPGDREAAEPLLGLAGRAAERIGLAPVLSSLDELRTRSVAPRVDDHRQAVATPAMFRRDGSVWNLAYGGRLVQMPHSRGLADLAHLLARPQEAVSVLELTGGEAAIQPASRVRGAVALDERARRQIKEHLRELDETIDEAERNHDGVRVAMAKEERQRLAEAVARDLGLGGRSRRVDDPVERARKTVSTRIRRTIDQIARAHPELGRHLARSIDTGTWCAYRPADPMDWEI